jgi:CubicO group peptidase (beta-lactamase class C family)
MSLTDAEHERLRGAFERQLDVGLHHGAQLAVYKDGELVVDFAGGTTGPDGDETTSDQRHVIFSCTKPYVAVAIHQLVEENQLAYDDRLVEYWPEFADEETEKAEITVEHVLSHTSGIPVGELDEQPEKWTDWNAVVEAMENIEPMFTPGEQPAYHPTNYGWLTGELVRRVTGDGVRDVVAERVFDPLGMDQTSIGLDEDDDPAEVATLAGFAEFDRCRNPGEGLGIPASDSAAQFNDPALQRAVIPAANGISTARDMARFYACLANGGSIDGVDLLDQETIAHASEVHAETESDGTLSRPARYGLGVWVGGLANDMFGTVSTASSFGHAGLGSNFGWGDSELSVGFAYVTNGIREESYEHAARVNAMSDAVRLVV